MADLQETTTHLNNIYQTLAAYIHNPEDGPLLMGPPIIGFAMEAHLTAGSFVRRFFDISEEKTKTGSNAIYEARIPAPHDLWLNTALLRDSMYEDGKGTWYSAFISVQLQPDGRLTGSAQFNYDDEPPFGKLIGSESPLGYYLDGQIYPRNEEHIPSWLSRQLEVSRDIIESGQVNPADLAKYNQDRQYWIQALHANSDPKQ